MGNSYDDLPVVADLDARPGHVTFGVVYDGAFVVLGQQKLGLVDLAKRQVEEIGAPEVSSPHDARLDELGKQLEATNAEHTALTAQVAALSTKVNKAGSSSSPGSAGKAGKPPAADKG